MVCKKPRQKFISFAATIVVLQQLDVLVKASGESRSALIKRLIAEAFAKMKR